MQVESMRIACNGQNFKNDSAEPKAKKSAEGDTDSGSVMNTNGTESTTNSTSQETPQMSEEEKARLEEERIAEEARKAEEEARLEAERWANFINEFGYNREDSSRSAIANHGKKYGEAEGVNPDKVYAYNGLDQATEDSIEGIQLDLDKYSDSCGYMLEDTGDKETNEENKQNYLTHVGMYIEKDLADYFGINVNYQTGEGERDLMSVYQQILQNNGIDEYDTSSAAAYNQYARTVLAGLSCDEGPGSFRNDYVCLNNIEVGKISPIVAPDNSNVQVADASETENNKTESGLEKRTVDDDSASKVLALAENYEGKESVDNFTKPFFERVGYDMNYYSDETAWCAAFASYVTLESGADVADWFKDMNGSAGCGAIYGKAFENSAIVSYEDVQPGDLIIYDDPNCYYGETRADGTIDYSMDHIGIVTSKDGEHFSTIEGNTGYSDTCTNGKVAKHEGLNINDYGTTHDQSDYGSKRVYFVRVLK